MFVNAANRKVEKRDGEGGDAGDLDLGLDCTEDLVVGFKESVVKVEETNAIPLGEKQEEAADEADEKQKILEGVRKMAVTMQSDIKDLLKNEWAGSI